MARRAQLCVKRSSRLEELSSAQRGQLIQLKRSGHPGELNFAQRGQLSSAQRGQLIQKSSALPKEVSSALRKRSAHPGELSSAQRGQFGQKSSTTTHPLRPLKWFLALQIMLMFIVTIIVLLHKQRNLDHINDPNTFLGVIISFEKSLREVTLRYAEFQHMIMLLIHSLSLYHKQSMIVMLGS